IDPAGLIVTNNHVVADAEEITVTLPDETTLKAQIVGRDSVTDLALLKVEPKQKLPSVAWGDSGKARVGDWVLAVGNPFGRGGTRRRIEPGADEIAESLGLDKPKGAIVTDVDPNGPAAKAKLQAGDVILAFDGKPVERTRQLPRMVADTPAEKTVKMSLWRD